MSIATAIQNAQTKVANAYTAISNKGGTLPATQDLANMPTAINSINTGGSKYGCTIDNLLGNIDANGVLQVPADTSGDIVFTGVKDIVDYGLAEKYTWRTNLTHNVSFPDLESITGADACYYTFRGCSNIPSISLPKLKNINSVYACYYMFSLCSSLTTVSLPELTTVSGTNACYYMFSSCYRITSVSLPKLTTVSADYACYYMFSSCSALTAVSLPELKTVSGNYAFNGLFNLAQELTTISFPKLNSITPTSTTTATCANMFSSCRKLMDIYFNSLTTTSFGSSVAQFNGMFNSSTASTSGNVNIHFPSNLQSTISGLQGYPNFGATAGRVTLLFDLTATS